MAFYGHMNTHSPFYECELVLLSSTAKMLLRQTSINQRVFSERIIIGDLKRSSSSLIDSSLEVAPSRHIPSWLLLIVDIKVAMRLQRCHLEIVA